MMQPSCDTFVAMSDATATQDRVIFAKNSDRQPNEPAAVEVHEAADYEDGSVVECTYIRIPQVKHTHKILICRPVWMFGAEMGVNEHGLAIGNEAIFASVPVPTTGLLGMDLVRLALERSASAREAVECILSLIKTHGCGGNGGFEGVFLYHNSFLMADSTEAFVLESIGNEWIYDRIAEGSKSISNAIQARGSATCKCSPNFEAMALHERTMSKHCRTRIGDPVGTYRGRMHEIFGFGAERCQRTTDLLNQQYGQLDVASTIGILQDHQLRNPDNPTAGFVGCNVCMHAGPGPVRFSQTTASLIVELPLDRKQHSLRQNFGPVPTRQFDGGKSVWWKHEMLVRVVVQRGYSIFAPNLRQSLSALQRQFILESRAIPKNDAQRFSVGCFQRVDALTKRLCDQLSKTTEKGGSFHAGLRVYWAQRNISCGMVREYSGSTSMKVISALLGTATMIRLFSDFNVLPNPWFLFGATVLSHVVDMSLMVLYSGLHLAELLMEDIDFNA